MINNTVENYKLTSKIRDQSVLKYITRVASITLADIYIGAVINQRIKAQSLTQFISLSTFVVEYKSYKTLIEKDIPNVEVKPWVQHQRNRLGDINKVLAVYVVRRLGNFMPYSKLNLLINFLGRKSRHLFMKILRYIVIYLVLRFEYARFKGLGQLWDYHNDLLNHCRMDFIFHEKLSLVLNFIKLNNSLS